MRIKLLLIIIFFIGGKTYSQTHDLFQPPAMYKLNNVRSRTLFYEYDPANWGTIEHFDHDGFITESIQFDSSGKKYLSKKRYEYDSNHFLLKEMFYNYARGDSTGRPIPQNKIVDSQLVKLDFDDQHRPVRHAYVDTAGKICSEMLLSYNESSFEPSIVIQKFYSSKGAWSEVTSYCDEKGMEENVISRFHGSDSSIRTSETKYRNTYDKSGRIKKRIVANTFTDAPEKRTIWREEYFYMSNGLLASKKTYKTLNGQDFEWGELFNYKFW